MKENKNTKKTWIQNGVFILIIITLYATGLHTEVIGFVQRGVLATGLMNPDIEEITHTKTPKTISNTIKADLNLKLMDSNGKITSLSNLKGKVILHKNFPLEAINLQNEIPQSEKGVFTIQIWMNKKLMAQNKFLKI